VQQAGIPLRRIVNEGDYLTWQRALEDPARARPRWSHSMEMSFPRLFSATLKGLQLVNVICSTGQPLRAYLSLPARGRPLGVKK
jgi:hypothetical protein